MLDDGFGDDGEGVPPFLACLARALGRHRAMSRPEEEDSASDTDLCRGQRRESERQREIAIDLDLGLGLGFEELPALPEPGAG